MKKIHQKEQEEATSMWEAGSIFFEVSSRDEAGHISAVHGDIPGGSGLKNLPAKTQERQETWVWLPGSGRSPGIGNINLLQCACLENSMDRGAWQAAVHRVAKNRTHWVHTHRCTYGTWQCPCFLSQESRKELVFVLVVSWDCLTFHCG